jgi:hypothetical protein
MKRPYARHAGGAMTTLIAQIHRLIAGVLAVAALGALLWIVWPVDPVQSDDNADAAFSGTLLLEQYACRRGETAGLIMRGVEDAYQPGNREAARFDRADRHERVSIGIRNYDDRGPDAELYDYFELPRTTVSGLIVVKMMPPAGQQNDGMMIGSYADSRTVSTQEDGSMFRGSVASIRVSSVEDYPGWSRRADIHWAALEDVELGSGESLVDFVRDPARDGVIDLRIADDTVVDFVGIAFCGEPEIRNGVTLWVSSTEAAPAVEILPEMSTEGSFIVATCRSGSETRQSCDPFLGDTRCNRSVPMLCYRPDNYPYPNDVDLTGRHAFVEGGYWSAGELALTTPVAGDQFTSIRDADEYCRAEFGEAWRVADFHLNSQGYRFWGIGRTDYSGRAWIDIRDQPHGTCWDRS